MGVCVGPGFVVNPDGSLGLSGVRSGPWPYAGGSCTPAAANGLRIDTTAGNLWAEPPDIRASSQQAFTQAGSFTLSATTTSPGTMVWNVANPDPCRPSLLVGSCAFTFTVSSAPGSSTPKVRADVYTGTPPAPPALSTLTPRWSEQLGALPAGFTQSFDLPFQVSIPAGGTMGVQLAVGAESSVSSGGLLQLAQWNYVGTVFTQRAVY